MSHLNAFQPIWPPNVVEEFNAWPEVREARKIYQSQKDRLRCLAGQALDAEPGAGSLEQSREIASLLHNISGTGAHFEEAALGLRFGELEQVLRGAFTAEALHPHCREILTLLDAALDG